MYILIDTYIYITACMHVCMQAYMYAHTYVYIYIVVARKFEHHYPHALKVNYHVPTFWLLLYICICAFFFYLYVYIYI